MLNYLRNNAQIAKFTEGLMVVFLLDYIILFAMETVLPGFVVEVFNLNILLMIIILLWLVLPKAKKPQERETEENHIVLKYIVGGAVALFILTLLASLYRLPYWQMVLYSVLAFFAGKLSIRYLFK